MKLINLARIDFGGDATGGKSKPEERFNVQPTTSEQTITPTEGSVFSGGTVHAVTSAIDSNIQPENIKEGVSILGVAGTLSGGSDVFVVPSDIRFGNSTFTEVPSYLDFSNMTDMKALFSGCDKLVTISHLDTQNATNMNSIFSNCRSLISISHLDTKNVTSMNSMFFNCWELTSIPPMDTSNVTNTYQLFYNCKKLVTIPPLDTSKSSNVEGIFEGCLALTTVEGIDFSGLTSSPAKLFGYNVSSMPNLTHFIVNGKINVSFSNNYSINLLTAIDYDSVKSILAAADRTDNTNAKTLAFNRTMADQNGELAALVSSCSTKGWTISGLTLQ